MENIETEFRFEANFSLSRATFSLSTSSDRRALSLSSAIRSLSSSILSCSVLSAITAKDDSSWRCAGPLVELASIER